MAERDQSRTKESEQKQQSGGQGKEDLKSREYRDAQGNVRHHTKTFEEQHQGESGNKR
jgi:hypothetical protein